MINLLLNLKNLPLYISLLLLLTCAKEDSQAPNNQPSTIVPKYTLTASAGEGGSVAPTTGSFNAGTQVSVTATPNSGYTFSGWSNGSTANPLTVTLNSNTSITANFALIPVYTITVSAEDGGSVSSEGGEYQQGTQLTLTATPNEGYEFSGWSDGSTEATRVITASENLSLTASFSELIISYTLTVTSQEGGNVSFEGGEYNEGTEITITATPDEGYRFIGWSDGSTEESITITLTEDTLLNALFEPIIYFSIIISKEEGGTVSSEGGDFEEGTEVTISATPNQGYKFTGWSNGSSNDTITLIATEDISITAFFEIITFNLSINSSTGGEVSSSGGEYTYGSNISVEAIPGEGYIFSHWSNDSEENPIDITMIDGDQNITAYFTNDLSIQDGFYRVYNAIGEGQGAEHQKTLLDWGKIIYVEFENNILKTGFFLESYYDYKRLVNSGYYCTECGKENAFGGYLGEMTDEIKKLSRNKVSWTHTKSYNNETDTFTIFVSKTDEIDGKNFFFENDIPISRTEIHNKFRQEGQGFYSDTVYRDINFDNPITILEAFVKDAARNGVDISNLLTQEFIISSNNSIGRQPDAAALASCDNTKIHINYEDYYGDQMMGPNDWGDLMVFYHELGHDALNLGHNCVSGGGMTDIMTYGASCNNSQPSEVPIGYFENNVNNSVEYFRNIARRMFQGVDQLSLNCTSSISEKINDVFEYRK